MTSSNCNTCLKSNAPFNCGHCQECICKKCAKFLDTEAFSFLKDKPAVAEHSAYCPNCHETHVQPEIDNYEVLMEKAKNIFVFFKGQGKDVRALSLKRSDTVLEIHDCQDYQETVLRLAFIAAQKNYNVLVDVETQSEKVHDGSYIILKWHGKAIAAAGDHERLTRIIDPKFTK